MLFPPFDFAIVRWPRKAELKALKALRVSIVWIHGQFESVLRNPKRGGEACGIVAEVTGWSPKFLVLVC